MRDGDCWQAILQCFGSVVHDRLVCADNNDVASGADNIAEALQVHLQSRLQCLMVHRRDFPIIQSILKAQLASLPLQRCSTSYNWQHLFWMRVHRLPL